MFGFMSESRISSVFVALFPVLMLTLVLEFTRLPGERIVKETSPTSQKEECSKHSYVSSKVPFDTIRTVL